MESTAITKNGELADVLELLVVGGKSNEEFRATTLRILKERGALVEVDGESLIDADVLRVLMLAVADKARIPSRLPEPG